MVIARDIGHDGLLVWPQRAKKICPRSRGERERRTHTARQTARERERKREWKAEVEKWGGRREREGGGKRRDAQSKSGQTQEVKRSALGAHSSREETVGSRIVSLSSLPHEALHSADARTLIIPWVIPHMTTSLVN